MKVDRVGACDIDVDVLGLLDASTFDIEGLPFLDWRL